MAIFKEKNKGIEFRIGKSIHMIPSKVFPLASNNKNNIGVFQHTNTETVIDEKVKEVFNRFVFRLGKCFDNARELQDLLENKGISGWDYWSGWLFLPQGYPVFHAWLTSGNQVLEYTDNVLKILEEIEEVKSEKELRESFSDIIVNKNKLLPSEIKTFGKVHKGFTYIGTRDTYENSTNIYKSLQKDHPSYSDKGMNLSGLSDIQIQIKDKQK